MEKRPLSSQLLGTEKTNLVDLLPSHLFPSRERLVAVIRQVAQTPDEAETLLIYKVFEVIGWLDKVAQMFKKPENEIKARIELVQGPLEEKYKRVDEISKNRSLTDAQVKELIMAGLKNGKIAKMLVVPIGRVHKSVYRLKQSGQI